MVIVNRMQLNHFLVEVSVERLSFITSPQFDELVSLFILQISTIYFLKYNYLASTLAQPGTTKLIWIEHRASRENSSRPYTCIRQDFTADTVD